MTTHRFVQRDMSLLVGVWDHRSMIATLQTEQVRTFLEGSEAVDFDEGEREGVYDLVRRTLVRLDYHRLVKPDQRLMRR